MKTIVIVGDSYSFGQGCQDRDWEYCSRTGKLIRGAPNHSAASEYCWGSLIGKNNPDFSVINLSRPGNCNELMSRALITSQMRPDIIFFAGSYHDRVVFPQHSHPEMLVSCLLGGIDVKKSSMFPEPKSYIDAKKNYLKYLFTDDIGRLNTINSIYASYGFAKSINAKFFWSCPKIITDGFNIESDEITELSPIFENKIPSVQEFDFSGRMNLRLNTGFLTRCRHINERGHEIYYNKVIAPLLDKIS